MKQFSPAAEQNKLPILEVIKKHFGDCQSILEIASGSGQHVAFFSQALPRCIFQPTEKEKEFLESISLYTESLKNVRPPMLLDIENDLWPREKFEAAININMIHISPFSACEALFLGMKNCLKPKGFLLMYGPFFEKDTAPVQSNIEFDRYLRNQNQQWGVRFVEDVLEVAKSTGFQLTDKVQMPANNLSLVFEKNT